MTGISKSIHVHFALRKCAITSLYCNQSKPSGLLIMSLYAAQAWHTYTSEVSCMSHKKVWDVPETAKNAMTHTRA